MRWLSPALALLLFISLLAPAAAAPGATLTGHISGQAGEPLEGALVELFRYGAGRVALTHAGGEGYFTFDGLDESSAYWVRAWAQGHAVAEAAWTPSQGGMVLLAPQPLMATVAARPVDPETRLPLDTATLKLQRQGLGRAALAAAGEPLTVPAGAGYVLRARAPGRTPAVLSLGELAGDVTRSFDLELPAAGGQATGAVVSAVDGAPLAGARMRAVREGHGVVAMGESGPQGAFSLQLAAPARYHLYVD